VTKSAVPEMVNLVEGKKDAGGLVRVRLVGIKVVLVIVIVLVGLEDRDRGIERLIVFAGMVTVLEVLAEVVMVIVRAVVDLAVNARRPEKSVLVVRP